jgi:hypothetical protein
MQRPRLFTALVYLKITHPVKRWYDSWYPLIAAVLCAIIFAIFTAKGVKVDIFGEDGLMKSINGLAGILVGFFIAALAAVATFPGRDMDLVMPGKPPTLTDSEITEGKPKDLSRRAFLSFLFGYLTFAALALFALGSLAAALYPLPPFEFPHAAYLGNLVFVFTYSFLLANVGVNALLGIHYLAYRIHVKPRQVRRLSTNDEDH